MDWQAYYTRSLSQKNFYSENTDSPEDIWNTYSRLKLALGTSPVPTEKFRFHAFQTSGGEILTALATPSTLVAHATKRTFDLYEYAAQSFQTSIRASTWPNERDRQASFCPTNSSFSVENIRAITLGGISWLNHMDHSKTLISNAASRPVVCIGDKNRSLHQLLRGGGTVCLFRQDVWHLFDTMIAAVETCPCRTLTR